MAECCSQSSAALPARRCPSCAGRTQAVGLVTVRALLATEARAWIERIERIESVPFRFCPAPACDVVYASGTGQVFRVNDVAVPVWQKRPEGDRILCYCFGENERDLLSEIESHGSTGVIARVRAHIAAGRCACEVRNPTGGCCLGDLIAAVARLQARRTSAS